MLRQLLKKLLTALIEFSVKYIIQALRNEISNNFFLKRVCF